jgi:hypothetical protein
LKKIPPSVMSIAADSRAHPNVSRARDALANFVMCFGEETAPKESHQEKHNMQS